jgi:hypothetical protein
MTGFNESAVELANWTTCASVPVRFIGFAAARRAWLNV